jgi:hypothetical protein
MLSDGGTMLLRNGTVLISLASFLVRNGRILTGNVSLPFNDEAFLMRKEARLSCLVSFPVRNDAVPLSKAAFPGTMTGFYNNDPAALFTGWKEMPAHFCRGAA